MNHLIAIAAFFLAAQSTVFRADVKLVEVYATVFDNGGRAVSGLAREQFEIRDDGAAQPIRVFETTDKSLSCALLLDTTGSMSEAIPALRNAARFFIDSLRPDDSVGVYSFTDHLSELSEMTSDKSSSRRSLARLRAGGRTALFDAISQLALAMESLPGKKAIVVLTDGGDNASILNRQSAAQRARKAGVPVFAIAEGDALRDDAAAGLLHTLSESTGGHLYKARHAKDIEKIFTAIALDLRNGYLLAFQAPLEPKPESWHELDVEVKNTPKAFKVRARTGYSLD
jgi:Ca-activated chloride channel homolog